MMDYKLLTLYSAYILVLVIIVVAGFIGTLPAILAQSAFTLVLGNFIGLLMPSPIQPKQSPPT